MYRLLLAGRRAPREGGSRAGISTNKFSSQQFFSCLIRTFDGVNANDVTINATVIRICFHLVRDALSEENCNRRVAIKKQQGCAINNSSRLFYGVTRSSRLDQTLYR
jgi:hypothetical protein